MDRQEVINKVWKHFVTDGEPYSTCDGACAYRGDKGTKCAVGLLIPDDKYKPSYDADALAIKKLVLRHPEVKEILGISSEDDVLFLSELQRCHDSSSCFSDFSTRIEVSLRNLIHLHELKIPE